MGKPLYGKNVLSKSVGRFKILGGGGGVGQGLEYWGGQGLEYWGGGQRGGRAIPSRHKTS